MSEKAPLVSSMVANQAVQKTLTSRMAEVFKEGLTELVPYGRGGLLDLQNFFAKAFPDSQQQESVLGMIGVPTPGMVDIEQETKASKEEQKPDKQEKSPPKSVMGYDLPAQAPAQGKEMEQERGRGM